MVRLSSSSNSAIGFLVFIISIVLVYYFVWRNPQFQAWLSQLLTVPSTTQPSTGGDSQSQPTVQGDYPYPAGGNVTEMDDQGRGTRHYASGKPDDVTHEWEAETSAQSYMIVIDITLTEIDHDDTISFKYGGTHTGSGWYDNGYSFNSGQACIGKEVDHPSTDLCEVTGTSIGNLVNKRVKLAAINFNKGEKLEMWSNSGSGWQKDVESSNGVTGFRPRVDRDECMIRIDAAPGIDMHSAQVIELTVSPGTTTSPTEEEGNIARILTARTARRSMRRLMYRHYKARRIEHGDFIPMNIKLRSLKYNKIGGI
jgi:hypothetical protein